jgi:hypothetical protein
MKKLLQEGTEETEVFADGHHYHFPGARVVILRRCIHLRPTATARQVHLRPMVTAGQGCRGSEAAMGRQWCGRPNRHCQEPTLKAPFSEFFPTGGFVRVVIRFARRGLDEEAIILQKGKRSYILATYGKKKSGG